MRDPNTIEAEGSATGQVCCLSGLCPPRRIRSFSTPAACFHSQPTPPAYICRSISLRPQFICQRLKFKPTDRRSDCPAHLHQNPTRFGFLRTYASPPTMPITTRGEQHRTIHALHCVRVFHSMVPPRGSSPVSVVVRRAAASQRVAGSRLRLSSSSTWASWVRRASSSAAGNLRPNSYSRRSGNWRTLFNPNAAHFDKHTELQFTERRWVCSVKTLHYYLEHTAD